MTNEKPARKEAPKKVQQPPSKKGFAVEKLGEGDWPEAEKSEGAPETETPESPKFPPKGVRRDREPVMETPEKPAVPERSISTTSDTQVGTDSAVDPPEFKDPDIADLAQHVSAHPVNAHAPLWTPRNPNTTGGYS